MFGSCFIEAALLVPKDWKVLRPLQQAFNVSVQLTATADQSLDLVLVLNRHYNYLFPVLVYKLL